MLALALAPAFHRAGDSGRDGFQQRARNDDACPPRTSSMFDVAGALTLRVVCMASTAVFCTRFSLCSTRHLLGGYRFFTIAWQLIQPPLGV